MSRTFILLFFSIAILSYAPAFAVEVAPRISDKEIIAGLSDIRGDIKGMKAEINGIRLEINGIRSEIKNLEEKQDIKIDGLRFEMNGLRSEMNARFDDIRWMFSIFITIALVMLGFVLRLQWQMHKEQAQMQTSLETQKDEISFLKNLIEKLLPQRGVL
jgi:chromosome segregation ATPase